MKLSDVIIKQKKTFVRKKINRHDREVMEDVRTVLPSNTRKVLQEWEIKFYLFLDYFAYFIECYLLMVLLSGY